MFLGSFKNYIKNIKKISFNTNDSLEKIKFFIINNIDENGYVHTSDVVLKQTFIDLIEYLLLKKNLNNVLPLLKNLDVYLDSFNNRNVLYKDYFETIGINISSLITTNILYDEIAQIIFLIYIYGTTINDFKYYILNNENFKKNINMKYLNILNDYIKKQDILQTYNFNANSFKLLILGHLNYENYFKEEKIIIENILFCYGRIVLEFINDKNVNKKFIKSLFNNFLKQYSAPSTPVYYNALKEKNVLSSCFIITMEDTVESIGFNLDKIFNIQKHNSGIGVVLNKIRSSGRPVMTNITESNSVLNFVDILSLMSNHYDNKKRNRSSNININLSVYHPEVFEFLKIKVNKFKKTNFHFNKIFQTLIIPDEFIYRYLTGNKDWYLIPSDQHINNKYLHEVHGEEFTTLYNQMIEDENIVKTKVNTEELFSEIVNTMIKTGGPFLFFENIINYTTNHKNLGKIQGTNLCTEILEYTDDKNTACCNVSSINLSKIYYFQNGKNHFDFNKFKKIIKKVVYYLNCSIDSTFYGHYTCKLSNKRNRPIAIGIQGLANLFNKLNLGYLDGYDVYKKICEYLYYYSLKYSNHFAKNNVFEKCQEKSNNINKEFKFHFDLFREFQEQKQNKLKDLNLNNLASKINLNVYKSKYIPEDKWKKLMKNINTYGLCNSLVTGFMPTSLSSSIYNNNESFEPFQQNIEKKSTAVYDCITYNQSLVKDLLNMDIYNPSNVLENLIIENGQIDKLKINKDEKDLLKKKYQTLHEINFFDYLKFTNVADPFVDQGISFNISIKNNNNILIAKSIITAWLLGKKTTYYYRIDTIIEPLSFNKKINKQTNISCYYSPTACKTCTT